MKRNFYTACLFLCLLFLPGCQGSNGEEPAPQAASSENAASQAPQEDTGTAAGETTEEVAAAQTKEITLYYPDSNLEALISRQVPVSEISGEAILDVLKEYSFLAQDVQLLSLEREMGTDGKAVIRLDLSAAFGTQLSQMGTSGEHYLMGSITNTFLAAMEGDCLILTVEGNTPESGHQLYDFPLTWYE